MDSDDIMDNMFASFGRPGTKKMWSFGWRLPKVTWKLECSQLGFNFVFCVNCLNSWRLPTGDLNFVFYVNHLNRWGLVVGALMKRGGITV